MLKWFAFIPVIVKWTPRVVETVIVVEGLFNSAKSGPEKKAEALALLNGIAVEAGWPWGPSVVDTLDGLIDTVVRIMNAYKIFRHGDDQDPEVLETARQLASMTADVDPELVRFLKR